MHASHTHTPHTHTHTIYIYIYIYIYIHIHTHMCVYIYIYIPLLHEFTLLARVLARYCRALCECREEEKAGNPGGARRRKASAV